MESCLKVEHDSTIRNGLICATCLATFSAVARDVTLYNVSCDLSRNAIARQVARRIAKCNSALMNGSVFCLLSGVKRFLSLCRKVS